MGCDIHLHVECRTKVEDDYGEIWTRVEDPLKECSACKGHGINHPDMVRDEYVGKTCYWCGGRGKRHVPFYDNRNYDVFAILADVRNGRGFAGVDTGDGFIPIDNPRGLPEDVSDEVMKESEHWGLDGHSHSWFTLRELLEYDWDQKTTHRGVVDSKEYTECKERGKPSSWCGGTWGNNVKYVTPDEMDDLLKNSADLNNVYTLVSWSETYEESATDLLEVVRNDLSSLGKPDDVRIVFWFDN